MKLSEELAWRGFVNQTTLKNIATLDDATMTFYWGVDPSADSMHVGQLAMSMMVKHFIHHGHKPILLVGGATGLIGDPDGKDEERTLKTREEIEQNKQGIARQYKQLFDGFEVEIVDNYDWFKDINYLAFLRDIGKHFSMSQLLDREFVKSRVGKGGSGISYAEFSYSLIQGYDFLHLYRTKGATLQVSGADQWGNSLSGVELIRKLEGNEAHVYTAPLITDKVSGKKFGKSEGNAIWIDESKTSAYRFYQFWFNTDDRNVGDYLKLYTFIQPDEFNALMDRFSKNPENREAQKHLAYEATKLVHGEAKAQIVQKVTAVLFSQGSAQDLNEEEVSVLKDEIPTTPSNSMLTDLLVDTRLVASKSEARRLIEGGAIKVNGKKTQENIHIEGSALLQKGKNSFAFIDGN